MKDLLNTLSAIKDLDINSIESLSLHPYLYEKFCVNVKDFIVNKATRSSTNSNHLYDLTNWGIDIEDIHADCLLHCVEQLNHILSKDLDTIIPYLYTVVGNYIIDIYRRNKKKIFITVSLDEIINPHVANNNSTNMKTREDLLIDHKSSVDGYYLTKESIIEIYQQYSNNPDKLLCYISKYVFSYKPRQLASDLINKGSVSSMLSLYQKELSLEFGLLENEFPIIAPVKKSGLTKKLNKDNPDEKEIAEKISNILNRTI